jgi:hypothetical protein
MTLNDEDATERMWLQHTSRYYSDICMEAVESLEALQQHGYLCLTGETEENYKIFLPG